MNPMRDFDELFEALERSPFRRKLRLNASELAYLRKRGEAAVMSHARGFVEDRLAPAAPAKDGRQTPWRGHPVFVAQHATGACCRFCLRRWHRIPSGRMLSRQEIEHILSVIHHWLRWQDQTAGEQRQSPSQPTLFQDRIDGA